jgi:hypothetical protein
MEISKTYENFPPWVGVISNLVSITIWSLGILILSGIHWIVAVFYFIFISVLEYRLLSRHCTSCYYWDKTCGIGKGRISSRFFRRSYSSEFCTKNITWTDMIPDMLVSFVPIIAGIVLLIIKFDFIILSAVVLMFILTTAGNALIRRNFACKYCRQRELGCPAEKLFSKTK